MKELKVWYELKYHNKEWTVWRFKEANYNDHGGYGSLGVYTSNKKEDCLDYCKKNNIKITNRRIKHDRIRL